MPAPAAEACVSHPAATALLVDPKALRFLRPFLARACGVSEAARELGVGRSLVSYWVGRLHRAGLLQPLADDAGHRVWRSSADRFLVALHDLPMDSDLAVLAAYMDGAFDRLKHALVRTARQDSAHWQYRVEASPQGLRSSIAPIQGRLADTRLLNDRANLHLSADEAAALRAELGAVLARYIGLSRLGPGRRRHTAWVSAVEDLPD